LLRDSLLNCNIWLTWEAIFVCSYLIVLLLSYIASTCNFRGGIYFGISFLLDLLLIIGILLLNSSCTCCCLFLICILSIDILGASIYLLFCLICSSSSSWFLLINVSVLLSCSTSSCVWLYLSNCLLFLNFFLSSRLLLLLLISKILLSLLLISSILSSWLIIIGSSGCIIGSWSLCLRLILSLAILCWDVGVSSSLALTCCIGVGLSLRINCSFSVSLSLISWSISVWLLSALIHTYFIYTLKI
jgi:hypothetical protein